MRDSRTRMRWWALLPMAVAAGTYYATPRILKRVFAPPRRDAIHTPADLGLPEEQVWLTSITGTRLHAWFVRAEQGSPGVVVIHGWGGNASLMLPLATHLHEAGFHALFLDARNHGLSEHDSFTSMPRFAEDLEVAATWMRDHPDVAAVGAIGHSVGAGAVILAASRGDLLDAAVAVASPAHPGEMMQEQMQRIPSPVANRVLRSVERIIGHEFDSFAPRHRISLVEVPLMLVHGSADAVVSIADLHALAEAQPNAEVFMVPGAGHSDLEVFEHHIGEITKFFGRHLTRRDGD